MEWPKYPLFRTEWELKLINEVGLLKWWCCLWYGGADWTCKISTPKSVIESKKSEVKKWRLKSVLWTSRADYMSLFDAQDIFIVSYLIPVFKYITRYVKLILKFIIFGLTSWNFYPKYELDSNSVE